MAKQNYNFELPKGIEKEKFIKHLLYDINDKTERDNLLAIYKNGSLSFEDITTKLENILTKQACTDPNNNCALAYKPYNNFEFETINPLSSSRRKYTKQEIKDIKNRFSNKCKSYKDHKEIRCCDPRDGFLEHKRNKIPKYYLDKFKKVDVKKCNNKIEKMRVCNDKTGDTCGEGSWRSPTTYELCKLMKLDKTAYENKKNINIDTLTPDCLTNKCSNDTDIFLQINPGPDNDDRITNHYYLINAIKKDDVDYLKDYYEKQNNSVNEQLLYGYSGNTSFHHAIYYNSLKCVNYLLTTSFDYSNLNKDDNSVLHIACLKGNYDTVFNLLKHGSRIECKNKYGDTALHSAVRSGSYNCVKILLKNNGVGCISIKNKYGEIPLHTAVLPVRYDQELDKDKKKELKDRMNFNIVKILIDYGSDIHSKNKDGDIILKTLSKKDKSLVREQIRTLIQRKYYYKYSNDEYNKLLNNFPEVRPFELNTEVEKELEQKYDDYKDEIDYKNLISYDENLRDEELYVKKRTKALKDFPDEPEKIEKKKKCKPRIIEHFSNENNTTNSNKCYNLSNANMLGIIIIIIIVSFIIVNRIN